jgi:zinc D-Ala-D-Ala carboxypeptidase
MPGTSRHHWGTDFDINSLSPAFFNKGTGKKAYEWLTAHAADYGFAQPYTAGRNKGYNEEKWHWSYTPLSRTMTQNYAQLITNQDITGFEGSASAPEIDMLNNYVLGVNELCK